MSTPGLITILVNKMPKDFHLIGVPLNEAGVHLEETLQCFNPKTLFQEGDISSFVVIHTCLRYECYYTAPSPLGAHCLHPLAYALSGSSALYRLLQLSCGMLSLLKGEDQILAQIKKAHRQALVSHTGSSVLNVAFNHAIALGKRFRSLSGISRQALSLEALAVKKILAYDKEAFKKNILILGLGDLSQSIMYILLKEGAENLSITNRSRHKCQEIAAAYGVKPVDFADKSTALNEADIIISATSATHPIVRLGDFYTHKPRFFLDLASPPDIQPGVSGIGTLCTLGDLWLSQEANIGLRDKLLRQYAYLIDEEFACLSARFAHTYA